MHNIAVIGAGVSGLTCARQLQQAGHRVNIFSRDLPEQTVSAVAAAIWFPFHAQPRAAVDRWSRRCYKVLQRLSEQEAQSGISMVDFKVLLEADTDTYWNAALPEVSMRYLEAEAVPEGFTGVQLIQVPMCDSSVYLPWLYQSFLDAGGRFIQHEIKTLQDLAPHYDHLINCSGLGAEKLAGDDSVYPVRGQVLRIPRSELDNAILDDQMPKRLAYVLPRRGDIILGGTAVAHRESMEADHNETLHILRLCQRLHPALQQPHILEVKVGLRPGRPAIRLEREAGTNIIHNYGHGGSGYTVSWGCAEDVAQLVAG